MKIIDKFEAWRVLIDTEYNLAHKYMVKYCNSTNGVYSRVPNKRSGQINVPMGILSKINKRTKPNRRTNAMGTLSKLINVPKKV